MPGDVTFFNDYNTDEDANYGVGVLTGALIGGATVAAGRLNLKGGTLKYVDYSAIGNADSLQVGCIRYDYIPDYSGSPIATRVFFALTQAASNGNNRIQLTHLNSGVIRFIIADNTGSTIFQADLGAWSPTLGQSYEFEINWDITTGASRVFIDGTQIGTTQTATGTRSSAVGLLRTGTNHTAANTSDSEFDNFSVFSTVQHTANYVSGTFPPALGYSESEVELPIFTHAGAGQILSLDSLIATEVGVPHYTFELNGGGHFYWDGAAWSVSDDTYAQSNDIATVNANISTFPIPAGATLLCVDIYFPDGNTQASVADLTVTHTANTIFNITNPTIIPTTSISQDALNSFVAILTVAGLDDVRFTLQLDGQQKYWSGVAWVDADGTYAQTNDLATIQANLATFTDRGSILPVVYLHSDDGSTTPNIDDLTIDFDFYGGIAVAENVCTVWGYLYDELNAPVVGVTVSVTPTSFGVTNNKLINRDTKTVDTDSTGYWEFTLIETTTSDNNWAYKFQLPGYVSTRIVPNADSAEFNDLVIAA